MKKGNDKLSVKRGFSLLEMAIVLIIIGLLAGTIVPLFNTNKLKDTVAQRFANQISNIVSAEDNYYMKNTNSKGQQVFADLQTLKKDNYISAIPVNPFYGTNPVVSVDNNVTTGTPYFTIKFYAPKNTLGVFYNLLPGLKKISENGNKVELEFTEHAPGLEASFDNLMHRDAGVNQELRTSHGPIGITDNVKPENSYLYITDDNTQTPEKIKEGNVENIASGHGVIKIGSLGKNGNGQIEYGIEGNGQDGNLYINANENNTPQTLVIGLNPNPNKGSKVIKFGLGSTKIAEIYNVNGYSGMKFMQNSGILGESGDLTAVNIQHTSGENKVQINDPTGKEETYLKLAATGNEPFITFQKDKTDKKEYMSYDNPHMPISFIGSIGGVYAVRDGQYLNGKWIGTPCANGTGTWQYKLMGILSFDNNYINYPGYLIGTENKTITTTLLDWSSVNESNGNGGTQYYLTLEEAFPESATYTLARMKTTPSSVQGLEVVLNKTGGNYQLKCYEKIGYMNNYSYYTTIREVPCYVRVVLMCMPKSPSLYNN